MAQFGASIQTAQVSTGNFQTTIDQFVPGLAGYPTNPGARNQVGAAYYDATGSLSNPNGVPGKYRYVRYNSTANPTVTAGISPVYWTDATFTTVSGVMSEGLFGVNSIAGLLMPNTNALATLTATVLNGNFVWICVGGYVAGVTAPGATAAGDSIIGAAGNFTPARVAAGTAPTNRAIGFATTAIAGGLCNVLVTLES